jgi:hypothetical protein
MTIKQYFDTLKLSRNATLQEAKAAYTHLMDIWNPDRFISVSSQLQHKAAEKSREIQVAYQRVSLYLKSPQGQAERAAEAKAVLSVQPDEETEKIAWREAQRKAAEIQQEKAIAKARAKEEYIARERAKAAARQHAQSVARTEASALARERADAIIRDQVLALAKNNADAVEKKRAAAEALEKEQAEKRIAADMENRARARAQKRVEAVQVYVFWFMMGSIVVLIMILDVFYEGFTLLNIACLAIILPVLGGVGRIIFEIFSKAEMKTVNRNTALFFIIYFIICGAILIAFYPAPLIHMGFYP